MRVTLVAISLALFAACDGGSGSPDSAFPYDVTPIDNGPDAATGALFCSLGGSTPAGASLPNGFCARPFAQLNEPRVLAFAPNGDLFVAAPSIGTPGGAMDGAGAIIVLSDDNHDGIAESTTFASLLSDVHGLAFGDGALYFTTAGAVWRTPYTPGQRAETLAMRTMVASFATIPNSRWTHGLARTPHGAMYATQSVYSANTCPDNARDGSISSVGATALTPVATGFRNPMYVRCHYADEACMAAELGDDGGRSFAARERLVLVRPGNFGFPCCIGNGTSTPYNAGTFDCTMVPVEEASFPLNDTPFGLDWERALWPAPFRNALVVALHGSFYSSPQWQGARIVFAPTDAVTHAPSGPFQDLVLGFGHGSSPFARPADVAFAPDGRLFFADDQGNAVYWVAPGTLRMR